MMRNVIRAACVAAGMAAGLAPAFVAETALAQGNPFSPAITVNGSVITQYELDQRAAFLKVLSQPGDLRKLAEDQLISDRLRMNAAKELGITVSRDEIIAGMTSFAAQGNLSVDDFLKNLAGVGVDPQTVRDFIKAGLLWRAVLHQKFAGRITVSEAEVDRAIAAGAASGGELRLEISEIVLPDDGKVDVALVAGRIYDHVKSPADFAAQAALNSKAGTARNGGALGWVDAKNLPPDVAAALAQLKPGEVTKPMHQPGGVMLYLLQGRSEGPGPAKGTSMVDYALFQPAPGADLAALSARLTTCDQLNVAARGLDLAALQRQTQAESSLTPALRSAVAGLDAGESTVVTTASGGQALVMLCSRAPQSKVEVSREDVKSGLINQKVGLLSNTYMEELRSQAYIVRS